MAEFSLTFKNLNISLQVGDMLYWVNTNSESGFDYNSSSIQEIEKVKSITTSNELTTITCEVDDSLIDPITTLPYENANLPTSNDFVLFSKDNIVNTSSILGYYAEVKFKNNSTYRAEMYATSCEISTSSK
tara:strand:- start:1345 stop:1737 length:393 start_codon:yes stop_codon:yes gene_type:complete